MDLVLAARLSKARKGQTGIDTQDQDARRYAEAEGHRIVGVAADTISGRVSPFRRKKLGPWLTDPSRMALYDGIITSKMDRYTRAKDWAMREWAEKNGKKLIIAQPYLVWPPEPGDTFTPILWDLLVDLAVAEWENTSVRYKRMLEELRGQGFLTGRRIYGFQIVTVDGDKHKTLIVDPAEARFVRDAVDLYLEGKSLTDVCLWLDSQGSIPVGSQVKDDEEDEEADKGPRKAPMPWSTQTLRALFRNPSLIGRREVKGGGKTILNHEPLLRLDDGSPDLVTWSKLQATMTARGTSRRNAADKAMLTGILSCGKCGDPMYRLKSKSGKNYVKFYYRCHGRGTRRSTCRNMIPVDELEALVDWHMTEGEEAVKPIMRLIVTPGHSYEEQIDAVDRQIAELDNEDPEWISKATVLREKRAALRALKPVREQVDEEDTGLTVADYWRSLDGPGRRAFLLASQARVRATRDRAIVNTKGSYVLPAAA